ncbi:MAG: hypothetical protein QOD76_1081 [Solirubrobacteraceae bacterium]|nr:hypothetical protein [Solirubrobacteraceae bacterium]
MRVTSPAWRFRAAALIAAGALAVHELRYLLAYGDRSGAEAAAQGHAYLTSVTTVLAALLVVAVATFIARLARGARAAPAASLHSPGRLWAALAIAVLTIFVLQESAEGLLSSGHPAGLDGVFGHGGWLALPLAAAVGALIALALGGAAASAAPVPGWTRSAHWPIDAIPRRPVLFRAQVRRDPLARHMAGRGPPPTFV